jgi:hypothetical protein
MILGIPMVLVAFLVLGSAVAVVLAAARDRVAHADPGLGTARRFFVYLLAALGLVAGANGVAWLLQALVGVVVRAPELTRDTTIALGVALTAVGVPAWLAFWGVAQRTVRAKPHEATFLLRQVYLYALLTASLATVAVAAVEVLAAVLGVASRHPAAPLATLVVWAAVWTFHARVERAEPPATEAGGTLRLLHVYGVAVVALTVLALATGSALQHALDAAYRTLVGHAPLVATSSPVASDALRLAVVDAAVAAVVWWWYGHRLARPATDGWPRAAATYAFGIFPGAAAVVGAASVLLYQALQVAFGAGPAVERFAVLPAVLATFVVGGGVWAVHDARARAEAALDPGRARAGRRTSDHLLAAIGLVAVAVGLVQALAAAFGALAPAAATLHGDAWRNPTILALTLLAVGGSLWVVVWRRLQRRAHAEPDVERAAGARRLYLTIAFGVGVAAALVAASVALYDVVVAVLAGQGLAALWDVRFSLATALVAAAVGGYHGAVLREDRAALAAATPRAVARARPDVVVLARRGDAEVVRKLEARWGGRVTVWWREDGDAPEAGALDVEALAARLEAVVAPRAVVWMGREGAEVAPVASA